jgi:hypothetical protein
VLEIKPCIATFTEDYVVLDILGEEEFTAKTDDSFIIKGYWGITEAELYYLVDEGAYEFTVEGTGDFFTSFPFDTSCSDTMTTNYLGVFKDVVVYSDADRTQEACSLAKGRSAAITTSSTGFFWISGGFWSSEPIVYKVELNEFSDECGGLTSGYVIAPEAKPFSTTTPLVPILKYISPDFG